MDPPDIFEAVIYTRWLTLPDTKRVGRGLSVSRDRTCIATHALFVISVLTICNEKNKSRRLQPFEKMERKKWNIYIYICFPFVPPQRRYEDVVDCSWKATCFGKKKFLTPCSHCRNRPNWLSFINNMCIYSCTYRLPGTIQLWAHY